MPWRESFEVILFILMNNRGHSGHQNSGTDRNFRNHIRLTPVFPAQRSGDGGRVYSVSYGGKEQRRGTTETVKEG